MTTSGPATTDPSHVPDTPGFDRRKAIGMGAIAAGAAWIAPAILTMDAAAAQTGPPPPEGGFLSGTAFNCQNNPNPFIEISATGPQPGGTTRLTTTDANGTYFFGNLPPGNYDVVGPVNSGIFTTPVTVVGGNQTTLDLFPVC